MAKRGQWEQSSTYCFTGTVFVKMEGGSLPMAKHEMRKFKMSVLHEVIVDMLQKLLWTP